jgi:beta-glucosidase
MFGGATADDASADKAISRARYTDVAIVVVGEHPSRSGEASSVSTLDLPAGQRELIEGLHDMGVPIVLVALGGRPLALAREVELAQAVLFAWHPGVEGGHAIADVLFGQYNPSGKLPVTFPRRTGQVPIYYSRKSSGRPREASPLHYVGYIDVPNTPLFPFGFGLSYTRFVYDDLRVSPDSDGWEVSADITNAGDVAGTEIAQLYARDLVGAVTRPVKELKGFARVELQPKETRRVTFQIKRQDLAFTGPDDKAMIEPGEFHVWVGPNSAEGLRGEFNLQ